MHNTFKVVFEDISHKYFFFQYILCREYISFTTLHGGHCHVKNGQMKIIFFTKEHVSGIIQSNSEV